VDQPEYCEMYGTKSINYLEAGFKTREGLHGISDAEFQNALVYLIRAIDLAPDVSVTTLMYRWCR